MQVSYQWRAHREPHCDCLKRRAARRTQRNRPDGAFGVSRVGRVRDRQANRSAAPATEACTPGCSCNQPTAISSSVGRPIPSAPNRKPRARSAGRAADRSSQTSDQGRRSTSRSAMKWPPRRAARMTKPSDETRSSARAERKPATGARNIDATSPQAYVAARKTRIRQGARSRPLAAYTHARALNFGRVRSEDDVPPRARQQTP